MAPESSGGGSSGGSSRRGCLPGAPWQGSGGACVLVVSSWESLEGASPGGASRIPHHWLLLPGPGLSAWPRASQGTRGGRGSGEVHRLTGAEEGQREREGGQRASRKGPAPHPRPRTGKRGVRAEPANRACVPATPFPQKGRLRQYDQRGGEAELRSLRGPHILSLASAGLSSLRKSQARALTQGPED